MLEPNATTTPYQSAVGMPSSTPTQTAPHDDVDRTGGNYYDADVSWIPTTALKKVARAAYPACTRTLQVMESIGGVIVNTFGLNQSRFQYAVDEYHRRERVRLEKEQMQYQKEREKMLDRLRRGIDVISSSDDDEVDDEDSAFLMSTVGSTSAEQREVLPDPAKKQSKKKVSTSRGTYCPPVVSERIKLSDAM